MLILAVKHLHVSCAILSIAGFCLRYMLRLKKSALLERRWMKVVPHVNDTLLLAAAIWLSVMTAQYPFYAGWLTAKIFGLIAYIILGSLALRPGSSPGLRVASGLAALAVFGWIVSVALAKQAWGFLAGTA